MDTFYTILKAAAIIFVVVMCFNLIIFVHELGHFLAGRWRGLKIDRFQIWFGKPIWKKEINGVQYGLGWIPAGGFVALPQMAPMESIEGGNRGEDHKPLPPITPLDKIIVAIAGPLFSMLLALLAAVVVWGVGKPKDIMPTQIVQVVPDGPAAKAGLLDGDKIIQVNGKAVNGFAGTLDSIQENIILSEGDKIKFTIERKDSPTPVEVVSEFKIPETKWFQRSGLRQVGIMPAIDHIEVAGTIKGSPGAKAGFKEGDIVSSVNGQKFNTSEDLIKFVKHTGEHPITFEILRDGKPLTLVTTPVVPLSPPDQGPLLGISFAGVPLIQQGLENPTPFEQVGDSLKMMWTTLAKLISPKSSISIDHLSGPVGIGKMQYQLLQMEDGWRRILSFMVLFNVNLAVLNMLPLPVLDGGHITLAILEKIAGRPVKARILEVVQTVCALALMSLMLYVTSKDIGDGFGNGRGKAEKIVFPDN